MFERILVPLDGSARAESAVEPAALLARANGGALIFVEVANRPNEYAPFIDSLALSDASIDRELLNAKAYLRQVSERPGMNGIPTETEVVAGPLAETIIGSAVRLHADSIVMASHGRTGVARWVLGSVAQKVVRRSPVPVLVLRDSAPLTPAHSDGAKPVLTLLVPLDGSPFAEEALAPAVALATSLSSAAVCRIRLLEVLDIPMPHLDPGTLMPDEPVDVPSPRTLQQDAHAYLDGVATHLKTMLPPDGSLTVSSMALFDIDAAEAIAAAAEGKPAAQGTTTPPCDAVVMTTHGRGGLALWALGSVTERVLSRCTRPLLVVRPAAVTAQQATIGIHEQQEAPTAPTV
jgi:nucleotide-binding universal stress UspA family protein